MKTVILMRHAKSDWGQAGLPDHERALNSRGRTASIALGQWLRDNGYLPGEVICSTATRTRQTLAGLGLPKDTAVTYLRDLYNADVGSLLAALRDTQADTVLLVAHNPSIAFCAHKLLARSPEHARFDDYPTGATLVATFDIEDWGDLELQTGTVADFIIPRELTHAKS